MSENNPFEIALQEKLDGFRIEPAASDWQAIYDRLHPRNKRRIIWWWIPLLAALGAGIFWAYNQNGNNTSPAAVVAAKPAAVAEITSPVQQDNENASSHQKDLNPGIAGPDREHINNPADVKIPLDKAETKSSLTHATGKKTPRQEKEGGINALTPETANDIINPVTIPASKPSPPAENNDAVKNASTRSGEKLSSTGEEKMETGKSSPSVSEKKPDGDNSSTRSKGEKPDGDSSSTRSEEEKRAGEKPSALTEEKKPSGEKDLAATEAIKVSGTATNIPVRENVRRWQWAAYLGAGPNYPSEPLALGPAALAANAPDYSSGSARTYTNTSNENGWHFNAGIMAEKKLGRNWLFSAGIGVNTNTWKTTIEKYKDSVFSGSLLSRYKLSSEQQEYRLWMAEIPLQFSNRISGKKAGSLWWTIGLNNQFRLSLKQQIESDSLQGNMLSDSRSLTSSSRFYQPQLRLGLLYNHNGNVHWQLLPLMQYTLTGVYSTDPPGNPLLINLQLQYRLFFRGKKEAGRAKK